MSACEQPPPPGSPSDPFPISPAPASSTSGTPDAAGTVPAGPGVSRADRRRALRLRTGVGLVVLSWLPIAQVYIWVAGKTSDDGEIRTVIWTVQIVIGFAGLVLAGAAAKSVIKGVGWRKLPGALWRMLRTGSPAAMR